MTLRKQLLGRAHGENQSALDARELDEPVLPVERKPFGVLSVYDDSRGCGLPTRLQAPIQCIQEKPSAEALATKLGADGQATKKRDWDHGIFRELLRELDGNVAQINRVLRKCVKTGDRCAVWGNHKWNCYPFSCVLTCLFVEVGIQFRLSTRKSHSVVLATERLNNELKLTTLGQSEPHFSPVSASRGSERFIRARRIEQSVDKHIASCVSKYQRLVIPDSLGCSLLCADHEKLGDSRTAQFGRALDQPFLVARDSSLQSLCFSSASTSDCLGHNYSKPLIVRLVDGRVKYVRLIAVQSSALLCAKVSSNCLLEMQVDNTGGAGHEIANVRHKSLLASKVFSLSDHRPIRLSQAPETVFRNRLCRSLSRQRPRVRVPSSPPQSRRAGGGRNEWSEFFAEAKFDNFLLTTNPGVGKRRVTFLQSNN